MICRDIYIRGRFSGRGEVVLGMQEVGPYVTDNEVHAKNLAALMLAFARQECA